MKLELRGTADELMQLALWLEMLSRMEHQPDEDQIGLITARVESGLRRVKVLRSMGGEGVTPDI
jgi:hypothetical protein